MSANEALDSEPDFSKETAQCDSKEEDGISSSGECDSPEPVQKSEDEVPEENEPEENEPEENEPEENEPEENEPEENEPEENEPEENEPEEIVSKKENCSLLRPMDGELDYEEEVCYDEKEKKAPDSPKKDDVESEQKDSFEDSGEIEDDDEEEKKDKETSVKEPKETNDNEKDDSVEEGEDEGEISDDDLEEGEVKDASPKPETTRQVCRFYGRGQCFYGNACRFLHLNHNEKGQYNMFAPRYSSGYGYSPAMGPSNAMMNDRSGPRGMEFIGSGPPPAPIPVEPSPVESAWERGLREAKELVKKANKRKEEEPDFDKKKLNLSIHVNEKNTPDYDKENEYFFSRSYSKRNEGHFKKYDEPIEVYENERPPRDFRGGRYENFEIRYTREDLQRDRRGRERSRGRISAERERYGAKEGRNKDRLKDDREFDIQMRTRAFEYVDPWRRSKTPKARRTRSRSGSYSSVSSYSYSDRSSRSSGSYSRSSSRSSGASSRSPSVLQKRKPSPIADAPLSPKGNIGRVAMMKKKPAGRPAAARNASHRSFAQRHSSLSRSRSRSSSSRSRSASRTPSVSRSRSYSRSISMDSVSSASSSVTHSSSASESRRNRGHASVLRKNEEKLPLDKMDSRNLSLSSYDKEDGDREQIRDHVYPSEVPANSAPAFPSFQHLLPSNDSKGKSQHKQQIKLTLLSKPASSKTTSFPKKEIDRSKLVVDQKNDSSKQDTASYSSGSKRPLSPTLSAVKSNTAAPKKSASSRRDELLKQLKAVEDAIARKRAKFC